MRLRLSVVLATAVVISVGLITLFGLLVGRGLGLLTVVVQSLRINDLAFLFIQFAVIVIATTILVGVFNLLMVHVTRLLRGSRHFTARLSSLVILLSFLAAVLLYIADRSGGSNYTPLLRESAQVSIESTLAALLFFSLVLGAARMLHRQVTVYRLLFVVVVLLVMAGGLPFAETAALRQISDWLMAIPVSAGARGILLGIGLATVVVGLRVLVGQDRSYGE